jgi:hypothetical protein
VITNRKNVRCAEKEMIKSTTRSLKRELAVNARVEPYSFGTSR